ncbi:MAG: AAA family ATPase [Alphaproteobacteria bacterium]|nr:AAA family ATPase [Alphaproteobacteria bacterium]MBQ8367674.1 AAA family ATPase [Alphaproteobacteria bacterium]
MQAAAKTQMTNLEVIKGAIAAKIDSAAFTSWIAPLSFDVVDDTLVLGAQNQFSADFINSVHSGVLAAVAAEFGLGLNIVVRGTAARGAAPIANDNKAQAYAPVATPAADVAATFDAFITTDENMFVVSACKKLAAGLVPFSPLFIYGVAGCGKSLLADCIAGAASGRVVKMSGAQFVSEFTRSLKEHNVFAFKDYCRNCETFILDDVQALSGKKASTEEFLQLVVDLRNAGKNVVLTANAAPSNLTGFDRHAQGLMASGLVADVVAPNAYVKTTMLKRAGVKADVADLLATRIANDGHMIAGVATKIKTYVDLMGAAVDMDVASRLLADTLQAVKTPMAMVRDMCEKLGVSYDAVCGNGRSRSLVLARQTMMAVLKEATSLSLAEIGNFVGGRDHATVLYGIKQIEKQKACDLVLAAQIQQLVCECK